MRRSARTLSVVLLAAGLAAVAVPLVPGQRANAAPAFSGFVATASASPIRVDVYEPTVPVPASPQLQAMLGYATVKVDSSSSRGRASLLWPGDPVGEGFRTVLESLGVPPELTGPVAGRGYPIQAEARHPEGPRRQSQEPVPGTVMRSNAAEAESTASTGYSTDCDVEDGQSGDGSRAPAPVPPPGTPLSGGQDGTRSAARPGQAEPGGCGGPDQLAALLDVSGYVATSRATRDRGTVTTRSRARLSGVELLGGLIELTGMSTTAVTRSDGKEGDATGSTAYGAMRVAGREVAIGPDGISAPGRRVRPPRPGDEPARMLKRLGVTVTVPEPDREVRGDKASSLVEGLVVDIDTAVLRDRLEALPLDVLADLVDRLPHEAAELKRVLGAVLALSPRFVIHLGTAAGTVDTVQGIELPGLPPVDAAPGEPRAAGAADTGASTGPAATGPTLDSSPAGAAPAVPAAPVAATPAAASAGLPLLFSIAGALLVGGLALAAAAGALFRKIGAAALGGGGLCSHGLRMGLPDLRKA